MEADKQQQEEMLAAAREVDERVALPLEDQAPMINEEGVYDLDAVTVADIPIKLGGVVYHLPGDPDTEIVAELLRLEAGITAGDWRLAASSLAAGHAMIIALLKSVSSNPEPPADLRMGVAQVLQVFALVTGGATVGAGVAEALRNPRAAVEELSGPLGRSPQSSPKPSSQ